MQVNVDIQNICFAIRGPDFKLLNGILIIRNPENKDLCYKYSLSNQNNDVYSCIRCRKEGHIVTTKIRNGEGEDYVIMDCEDHICIPIPYESCDAETDDDDEISIVTPESIIAKDTDAVADIVLLEEKEIKVEIEEPTGITYVNRMLAPKTFNSNSNSNSFIGRASVSSMNQDIFGIESPITVAASAPSMNGSFVATTKVAGYKSNAVNPQLMAKVEPSVLDDYVRTKTSTADQIAELTRMSPTIMEKLKRKNVAGVDPRARYLPSSSTIPKLPSSNKIAKTAPIVHSPLNISNSSTPESLPDLNETESKIIEADGFEIVPNKYRGNYLLLRQSKCIFYFNPDTQIYNCSKCELLGTIMPAYLHTRDDGTQYVKLGDVEHCCSLKKKKSDSALIIQEDGFVILNQEDDDEEEKVLKILVFTSEKKDLCHQFSYVRSRKHFQCGPCAVLKKVVIAKLFQDKDGKNCLTITGPKHACNAEKYNPKDTSNFDEPSFENLPFKLFPGTNGVPKNNLVIFTSEADGIGYEYLLTITPKENIYYCRECTRNPQKKHVSLKIRQDTESYERYLEPNFTKHICEPINFKKDGRMVVEPYFKESVNDEGLRTISIQHPKRKNKSWTFTWDRKRDAFSYKHPTYKNNYMGAIICTRTFGSRYILLNHPHTS